MIDAQQRAAAKAFAKNWKDRGYEKGDSQIFWVELLTTVFGVTEISQFISFEDQVHLDHTSFIDGYIEKTHTDFSPSATDGYFLFAISLTTCSGGRILAGIR